MHNLAWCKTSLFQDESGIWRCGGRLHHVNLSFSSKHPVILSKKPTLMALIAHSAHARVQHNGVKETLTESRAKYWIVGGRSLVRSIIHKCVVCRRFEGKPFTAPPLPSFCVNEAPPFAYTAVDFAGPMYIKLKGESSRKCGHSLPMDNLLLWWFYSPKCTQKHPCIEWRVGDDLTSPHHLLGNLTQLHILLFRR